MQISSGSKFNPATGDQEKIAGFGAPIYVAEPSNTLTLRGWSWESRNHEWISAEARYLNDNGHEVAIRTWKSFSGSQDSAMQTHVLDVMVNLAGREPDWAIR